MDIRLNSVEFNVSEDVDSWIESAIQFVSVANYRVNFFWKEQDQGVINEFMRSFMSLLDGLSPEVREVVNPSLCFIVKKTAPNDKCETLTFPYGGTSSIAEWVDGVIMAINSNPEMKSARNGILSKQQIMELKKLVVG